MILIWPFLVSIGKLLIPNLIRTAVPILASAAVSKLTGGPPQAPQQAAYYDDEEFEEFEEFEDEEYEEDYE